MLTRLKVNGFKNLQDVDVRLGPFTCIAGPNGVGKSNLFDAIAFLAVLADKPLLDAALSVRGGEGNGRELVAQYIGGDAANGIGPEIPPGFVAIGLMADIPTYRALRMQDYTYIEWYDGEELGGIHEYELYDLHADPYQLGNLLATPLGRAQHHDLVEQLAARLDQLAACADATCP